MKNPRGQIGEAKNQRFFLAPLDQKLKKGQIGDTMTWVVATLVIVVILGVSVFAATLSPIKSSREFKLDRKADLLATKSLVNYLSSEEKGEIIYTKLRKEEKLKNSTKIIEGLYEDDYYREADLYIVNNKDVVSGEIYDVKCEVESKIKLNNLKDILLCLGRKG